MAIEQVSITITGAFTKVAAGDCIIQTPNSNQMVEFSLSSAQPSAGEKVFSVDAREIPISIKALGSNVWVRVKQVKQTPGITVSSTNTELVVARAPS